LFFRLKVRHILEKEAQLQHEKRQFVNFAALIFAVQKCLNFRGQAIICISRNLIWQKERKINSVKICTLKVVHTILMILPLRTMRHNRYK